MKNLYRDILIAAAAGSQKTVGGGLEEAHIQLQVRSRLRRAIGYSCSIYSIAYGHALSIRPAHNVVTFVDVTVWQYIKRAVRRERRSLQGELGLYYTVQSFFQEQRGVLEHPKHPPGYATARQSQVLHECRELSRAP